MLGVVYLLIKFYRNNTRNVDLSLAQIKANEKSLSAAKKDKPKRPFNISDIHRMNLPALPGVLIEKSKPVNITECFNLLKPNDKWAQLEQNKQQNLSEFTMPAPKELVVEQEYSEDSHAVLQENFDKLEDMSYYDPSYIDNLEVKDTVFNIDQNMFNPKALLQCFGKDESEDIVPPPPEFSDYLNTTLDTNADVTLSMDCYEPIGWNENLDVSEGINKSIFQDNCQFELTPSKEIETWNLSRDQENCKMNASPDLSPYSLTIMRNNKEPTKLRTSDNNLQNKLKQFKFNHKSKFKL